MYNDSWPITKPPLDAPLTSDHSINTSRTLCVVSDFFLSGFDYELCYLSHWVPGQTRYQQRYI